MVLFCISAGGFSPTGRGRLPAYNTLGTDPPHRVETILPPAGRGHAEVEEETEEGKKIKELQEDECRHSQPTLLTKSVLSKSKLQLQKEK